MLKILIVDDHALFREGLSHVLQKLDDNISLLEAPDFDHALEHVTANTDLDLVLLDLNLPGKDGFSALETITRDYPALPIVILSASCHRSDIQRAMDSGAMGYIPKDTSSAVMLNALRLVLSGGIYVPPYLTQNHNPDSQNSTANSETLTKRQLQVLTLLARGHSNKEIANKINLAEATVKMHVTSILKALGVSNRTQAAMAAEKLGLALPDN